MSINELKRQERKEIYDRGEKTRRVFEKAERATSIVIPRALTRDALPYVIPYVPEVMK